MKAILQRLLTYRGLPDLGLGSRGQARATLIFTRPFLVMHYASELYTARVALGLALDLGWEFKLRHGATVTELIDGFAPQSQIPAEWMLSFLVEEKLLRQERDRYFLDGEPNLDLSEIRAFAAAEAPGHEANFDLLDAVRRQIKPFFTDGKSGESLLFDLAVFPIWLAFFRNENLVYLPNNLLTIIALEEALKPGSRILELGGGAGSFSQLLAQNAAEFGYLSQIESYRFTDIAPSFLRKAQRELREKAPGLPLSFSHLDINRPFEAQGLEEGAFDVIVGVNVAHVAVDLQETLEGLRGLLAEGGRLVLGECIKSNLDQPIYMEFFFKFLKSFTDVHLDPVLRPAHGFLTPEIWEKALLAAGFRSVRRIPDTRKMMSQFPSFYLGALAAER